MKAAEMGRLMRAILFPGLFFVTGCSAGAPLAKKVTSRAAEIVDSIPDDRSNYSFQYRAESSTEIHINGSA
jgi:hypothetical protein